MPSTQELKRKEEKRSETYKPQVRKMHETLARPVLIIEAYEKCLPRKMRRQRRK